jgi:tetratricopeptide (TPR) repeat protein
VDGLRPAWRRSGDTPVWTLRTSIAVGRQIGISTKGRSSLGSMVWPYKRGWRPPNRLERSIAKLSNRALARLDPGPEKSLELSQQYLEKGILKGEPDSSFTVNARLRVADQLAQQERRPEELIVLRGVLEAYRTNLGEDHDLTLNTEFRIATCLERLGQPDEAEPLLRHVAASRASTRGDDDPGVLNALAWLGQIEMQRGRSESARHAYEQALTGYELRGEGETPRTMAIAAKLATVLFAIRDLDAATILLRHVHDVRSRGLGPDDRDTLTTLHMLSSALFLSGDVAEAEVLARSLVAARSRVDGENAKDTIRAKDLLARITGPEDPF